jgi:hypothetical protein
MNPTRVGVSYQLRDLVFRLRPATGGVNAMVSGRYGIRSATRSRMPQTGTPGDQAFWAAPPG